MKNTTRVVPMDTANSGTDRGTMVAAFAECTYGDSAVEAGDH